jgi:hypothetical protein
LAELLERPENVLDGVPEANDRLTKVIVDPYANAIHVSLLREKLLNPVYAEELKEVGVGSPEIHGLRAILLTEGPAALGSAEKLRIMSDGDSMAWLHSRVWTLPKEELGEWWHRALRSYGTNG